MFFFAGKDLETLSEQERVDFINSLISNKIQESTSLEYKKIVHGDNKEIAKDIADKANSEGAHIIYGMEENIDGLPTTINWLTKTDKIVERIDQIATTSISPPIQLKQFPITNPKTNSEQILIVYIPKSNDCLHAVTVGNEGKFPIRRNRIRSTMQPSEIQARYALIEKRKEKEKELIKELETEFNKEANLYGSEPYENIILIPTSVNQNKSITELSKIITEIKPYPVLGVSIPYCGGLMITNYDTKKKFERCAIIRSNLVIERREKISGNLGNGKVLSPSHSYKNIVKTIQFARKLYQNFNYFGGIHIILNIKNASGIAYEYYRSDAIAELKQNYIQLDFFINDLITFDENTTKIKIETLLISLVSYANLYKNSISGTLETFDKMTFEQIEKR